MMQQQRERGVKVEEVCLVAPSSSHGTIPCTSPTSLPLTYLDLRCLTMLPAERLFFYEFPHPTTSFYESVLPNLKLSLSLTLQHFLPLAGNITWPLDSPYPFINYVPGDDAVSFTIAESNSNFNILCSNLCEAVEREPLIPALKFISSLDDQQASPLALQVTLFPNFGFCVGLTAHHGAVDGNSTALFISAWAHACSKLLLESSSKPFLLSLPEHLTPLFDRSVIVGGDTITIPQVGRTLKPMESSKIIQAEAVKGLFEFTPSHIQKLKQFAQSKLKMSKVCLSTFSVTCACVLTCLVRAQQPKAKRLAFMIPVNCRSRFDPPISPTYFGNCSGLLMVVAKMTNLLGNEGFINALEGIIEALNRVEDGVPRPENVWDSKFHPLVEDKSVLVVGSPRFEHYSADFGWGRPKNVDFPIVDNSGGVFSFLESRNNNGGIEIGLVLNKKEMEAFADNFTLALKSLG